MKTISSGVNTLPFQSPNFLYDLSNPHFSDAELLTDDDKILKGQFVQFKVVKGEFENLYPAEKYCFVPAGKRNEFWAEFEACNGGFKKFPDSVMEISMRHIRQITLKPVLVPGK